MRAGRSFPRLVLRRSARPPFGACARRADWPVRRLVKRADGAHGAVEQVDLVRKGIAEEAGHPQRDVDTRTAEVESQRISNPVTRPEAWSQTGLAPISASAWAMSSPPVRILACPRQVSTIAFGHSP
jgi:hypothetical protein